MFLLKLSTVQSYVNLKVSSSPHFVFLDACFIYQVVFWSPKPCCGSNKQKWVFCQWQIHFPAVLFSVNSSLAVQWSKQLRPTKRSK